MRRPRRPASPRSGARASAAPEFRRINVEEAAVVVLAVLDGLSLQLTFDRGLMTLPRAALAYSC